MAKCFIQEYFDQNNDEVVYIEPHSTRLNVPVSMRISNPAVAAGCARSVGPVTQVDVDNHPGNDFLNFSNVF